MENENICPYCGAELPDADADYCDECGTRLTVYDFKMNINDKQRLVDSIGTVYEANKDEMIVQSINGKIKSYRMKDMMYPKNVADSIFGSSTLMLSFAGTGNVYIGVKKADKNKLNFFRSFLLECYERQCEEMKHEEKKKRLIESREIERKQEALKPTLIECPCCGKQVSSQAVSCPNCGQPIHDSMPIHTVVEHVEQKPEEFTGIYRQTLFHGLQEVYCPNCKSSDCSRTTKTSIKPGKTKTTYSANLNPLKPFTLVNKKEKVIRKEKVIETEMFVCNKCGRKFY